MFNFMLKDILGVCLAFLIFPVIFLFPGYVTSWAINLLDFRQRTISARYIIAILISTAIVPILAYLLALYFSFLAVKLVLAFFLAFYAALITAESIKWIRGGATPITLSRYQKIALAAAGGWIFLATTSLVDLQWGDRLYNNAVSLDFATRVTMINAVTRTGVPPVNPGFFPGHPEYITSVHYFWYILCSVIDQIGGNLVDARMALIAGDIWCGLAVMALVALYIRLRNSAAGEQAWKTGLIGIGLLTISGLDVLPALINMLVLRFSHGFMWPAGDIEHWNEQITAWIGSLFWVPHHVMAMVACLTGFLLFQYYSQKNIYRQIPIAVVAGLGFASAAGLSTWVTITFAVFLGTWIIVLLIRNKDKGIIPMMVAAGLVALLSASPFLLGILQGGTGASGGLPIAFSIRRFFPVIPYISQLPEIIRGIIYILLLPVNYAMELGFFFFIGLFWIQKYKNSQKSRHPFFVPEIILLSVVIAICSFVRSAIAANDLGWRGWLFGQFVLLIWTTDLSELLPPLLNRKINEKPPAPQKAKLKKIFAFLLLIGFVTSAVDVTLLRSWSLLIDANIAGFPNDLSPDTHLGQRTFAARLAYEFIAAELPGEVVIQPNPFPLTDPRADRPSGLYASRQNAVSINAAYNVPQLLLDTTREQISQIFTTEYAGDWAQIDMLCKEHFIDVIVASDLDPLWKDLQLLHQQRAALYKNDYYAVFACGNFIPNDYESK